MNPTQTLHAAYAHYPNAIATICGERQQSWTELRNRVERLAGSLVSQGVAAGDRVAILAMNSDRYLEYYYAVWWAGAVVVPLKREGCFTTLNIPHFDRLVSGATDDPRSIRIQCHAQNRIGMSV